MVNKKFNINSSFRGAECLGKQTWYLFHYFYFKVQKKILKCDTIHNFSELVLIQRILTGFIAFLKITNIDEKITKYYFFFTSLFFCKLVYKTKLVFAMVKLTWVVKRVLNRIAKFVRSAARINWWCFALKSQ